MMQQVTPARCDDPPLVSTRSPSKAGVQTPLPTKLPTVSPLELSTAIPSNLPSSSISFTEKPLPAKSVLPSVSPTQEMPLSTKSVLPSVYPTQVS